MPVVEWTWFRSASESCEKRESGHGGRCPWRPAPPGKPLTPFPGFSLVSGRQQASGGKLQNRLRGAYDRHPTVDFSRESAWQVIVCMADPSPYWRVREGHVEFKCGSMIARYISLIQTKYRL